MEWLLGNIVICIHSIKWSLRYAALRSGLILYLMSCCITFATLGNYNNPRHKIDFEIVVIFHIFYTLRESYALYAVYIFRKFKFFENIY